MNSFDRERLRIQRAKMLYPPGTRIVLGEMSDPYAPVPPGTRGTVKFVDDMGTIHPQWDNGKTLGLIYGEDSFRKLTQEELEEESQTADEAEETDEAQDEGGMGFGILSQAFKNTSLTHSSLSASSFRIPNAMLRQYFSYFSAAADMALSEREKNKATI